MNNSHFFSEVIASSLSEWTAQCWQWNVRPHFAQLMICQEKTCTLFGLVYAIQTGSLHGGRTPFAYQKTEEQLRQEQPHIFELLQTTFTCLTVGYCPSGEQIHYHYAPQPPQIHSFVRPANAQELHDFFSQDRYLSLLFSCNAANYNLDELLLMLFKIRNDNKLLTHEQLQHFIETFSLLTGNDYRRLKLFLHRLQPLIQETSCSVLSKIV